MNRHAVAAPPIALAPEEKCKQSCRCRRETVPEGIAIDGPNVYFGNRSLVPQGEDFVFESEILKILANGKVDLFATLPDSPVTRNGVLGLTTDRQGNVYAALDTGDEATRGVWKFSKTQPESERLAGSENMEFPNALTFDDAGNLYATDSLQGEVWRFTFTRIGATAALGTRRVAGARPLRPLWVSATRSQRNRLLFGRALCR